MWVVQRTGAGSNPRISRVVSKSDSNHRTASMAHRTLGLTPAVLFAIVTSPSVTILYLYIYMVYRPVRRPLNNDACDCRGPVSSGVYMCVCIWHCFHLAKSGQLLLPMITDFSIV